MIVTIGFTVGDRPANYYPMSDGFRAEAVQRIASVTVRDSNLTPEEIAEAAFVATNHPEPETLTGLAHDLFVALETETYRSLSVGDTVTIVRRGAYYRLACGKAGWTVVL